MPLHIANLGSSFAAGPGIAPQADCDAGRSAANYAHIIADQFGAKLTDLTVSGATLLNVLNQPQVANGKVFPPQLQQLPEDADIIMILGGGNDFGYIGGLISDTYNSYWIIRVLAKLRSWIPLTVAAPQQPLLQTADELAARYGEVLDSIHVRAPKASVYVIEYLTVLGSAAKPGIHVPFHAGRLEHHKKVAHELDLATKKALQGRKEWCTQVSVTIPSETHGLGSIEPWVTGGDLSLLYSGSGYHPNAEGMKAVADMILAVLLEKALGE